MGQINRVTSTNLLIENYDFLSLKKYFHAAYQADLNTHDFLDGYQDENRSSPVKFNKFTHSHTLTDKSFFT